MEEQTPDTVDPLALDSFWKEFQFKRLGVGVEGPCQAQIIVINVNSAHFYLIL